MERRLRALARGDLNRDVGAANPKRHEARREFQEMADRLSKAASQIRVPVSRLLEEATNVRARMIVERDAMIGQRAALGSPKVEGVRSIERKITEPAKQARILAKSRLARVNHRVRWVRARRQTLAFWLRNPARMIWAEYAEANFAIGAKGRDGQGEAEWSGRREQLREQKIE